MRVVDAGGGFFVEADQPHAYEAGGEVHEVRPVSAFDMRIFNQAVERWKPIVAAATANREKWIERLEETLVWILGSEEHPVGSSTSRSALASSYGDPKGAAVGPFRADVPEMLGHHGRGGLPPRRRHLAGHRRSGATCPTKSFAPCAARTSPPSSATRIPTPLDPRRNMEFIPTSEKLIPDLTPREELVILARALWREGYDDHIAGHITYRQPDDTFLCNPWYLLWGELRPEHVIRIDIDGNVLEGHWPVPLGIPLHLALHRLRQDVTVAMHNHPRFGTIWADAGRIPPVYDQSSAQGGGELALVDEYEGGVNNTAFAESAVKAMNGADLALLANHGVFVLGKSIRAVHQRAVALEQRCKNAWHVEALGGGKPLAGPVADVFAKSDGDRLFGFWEAMVRVELDADPSLLGSAR